jgi:hypothetical protein
MPWVKIPADRLQHLPLFGIDLIEDQGDFAWYHGPLGRMRIEKADPNVFVEEISEAIELGAKAILVNTERPEDQTE